MDLVLDGEPSLMVDGEEDETETLTRKILQKDHVVDRFTRAELYYKKVWPMCT